MTRNFDWKFVSVHQRHVRVIFSEMNRDNNIIVNLSSQNLSCLRGGCRMA